MSHTAEQWTDRFGHRHVSCAECEEAWPCREAKVKPPGWLVPGYQDARIVVEAVAHGFDVTTEDVLGSCHRRRTQVARACAMAVVKQTTGWSYSVVGNYFGRHHTTVMSAVERVMGDPTLAAGVAAVIEELRPAPRLFAMADVPMSDNPSRAACLDGAC